MEEEDEVDGFVSQGTFEVEEADRLLPRLKADGIRFEIEMKTVPQRGRNSVPEPSTSNVALFVHSSDIEAWQKIRGELYPV